MRRVTPLMNCSYPAELTSFTPWRLTRKGSKQQQLLDLVGCRSLLKRNWHKSQRPYNMGFS